jgi:hypothetical protein
MKFKVKNKFVVFFFGDDYSAVTIAPFGIYMKEKYLSDEIIKNHESIHWKQQIEMGILPFYFWYGIEYLIRAITFQKDAYMNISMERESYRNENNLDYLKTRKSYSWFKYLFQKN